MSIDILIHSTVISIAVLDKAIYILHDLDTCRFRVFYCLSFIRTVFNHSLMPNNKMVSILSLNVSPLVCYENSVLCVSLFHIINTSKLITF